MMALKIKKSITAVVASAVFSFIAIGASIAANSPVPGWDPNAFTDQNTLEIMTTAPDEGEHWSKVWLVVVDGQLYVRLGERSFGRIQKNTTNPYLKVKVGDQEFDRVRWEPALDMKDKVAAAMADKYFMDILLRYASHPMTARLVAEPTPPPTGTSK